MRRGPSTRAIAAAALAAAALAPTAAAADAAPRVRQLVAFPDGSAHQKPVRARAVKARVRRKRCRVGAGTPLAALIRSRPGKLSLKDYGACSKRAADAAGLYVAAIAGHRARGMNGWVYKVGNRVATAGAGDPGGPFGHGRLHSGARVTWLYCRMRRSGCQRTLGLKAKALGGGKLRVTVRAYDDRGRSKLERDAAVHAGAAPVRTDARGRATLELEPGRRQVWVTHKGRVRSFVEKFVVR
jgi:hypothetical protein